jgi:Protein of unknown function (DUF1524)
MVWPLFGRNTKGFLDSSISNLVFLTRRVNIRASNWDFERKKSEYFASEDGSSPFVITQEVLRTTQWSLEHLAERQQRLLKKLAEIWQLDIATIQNSEIIEGDLSGKGVKDATEAGMIAAKRNDIIHALEKREHVKLLQRSAALYSDPEGEIRVVCTISKRYRAGSPYWYGYSPQWESFLSEGKTSFFVLGCMDRDRAFAIPHQRFSKLLKYMNRTGDRHWHVFLEEDEAGQVHLAIPKTGSRIGLSEFEIPE